MLGSERHEREREGLAAAREGKTPGIYMCAWNWIL